MDDSVYNIIVKKIELVLQKRKQAKTKVKFKRKKINEMEKCLSVGFQPSMSGLHS